MSQPNLKVTQVVSVQKDPICSWIMDFQSVIVPPSPISGIPDRDPGQAGNVNCPLDASWSGIRGVRIEKTPRKNGSFSSFRSWAVGVVQNGDERER